MKCPQLLMFRPIEKSMESNYFGDCLKEECAWWDEPTKRCLFQNISEKLSFIYLELNEIRGKIRED